MENTKVLNEKVIAFALLHYDKLETLFVNGFGEDGHYDIQVKDGVVIDMKFTRHLLQRRKTDKIY